MAEHESEEFLSERERQQLLASLHSRLFWVGEEIPYSVDIKGRNCKLHDIVWSLVNKDKLSDEDTKRIENYVSYLREKAAEDELELQNEKLTRKQAKEIFSETAGLLRAIMDLKEIEDGTSKDHEQKFHDTFSKERVAEARRWLKFLKDAGNTD